MENWESFTELVIFIEFIIELNCSFFELPFFFNFTRKSNCYLIPRFNAHVFFVEDCNEIIHTALANIDEFSIFIKI